jgi:hypothetical protein
MYIVHPIVVDVEDDERDIYQNNGSTSSTNAAINTDHGLFPSATLVGGAQTQERVERICDSGQAKL